MILTEQQAKVTSEHFEWPGWEEAFDYYSQMVAIHGADKVQFVCSTHPYTSGYWVEAAGCECSVGDDLLPAERVGELRQKIEQEIISANQESRTPKFVTL